MISSYDVAVAVKNAIAAAYPAVSAHVINLAPGATIPAVIVSPMNTSGWGGSYLDPHEMADIYIGITSIGKNAEQASGIQMAINRLLLRRTGSSYTTSLTVDSKETLWREPASLGSVVPGDNVFRTDDTYSFKEML